MCSSTIHTHPLVHGHNYIGTVAADKTDDNASVTDDTCSHTGDSGFSDSRTFMKVPQAPAHVSASVYVPLNAEEVHTAAYYKSLNRKKTIPGTAETN